MSDVQSSSSSARSNQTGRHCAFRAAERDWGIDDRFHSEEGQSMLSIAPHTGTHTCAASFLLEEEESEQALAKVHTKE